jgi:transcriptional regulator of acetoin/glycerol metabolism
MKFLLFSKKSDEPVKPSLVEFEPGQNKQITEFCSQYGTLCLMSPATFDSIQKFIVKAGFIDCKVKRETIDLYRAAQTDSPVLILGESGTGKDVTAHQICTYSHNYKNGFFRVNCSALPETLLESELFGYLKGSFTGAGANKKGNPPDRRQRPHAGRYQDNSCYQQRNPGDHLGKD